MNRDFLGPPTGNNLPPEFWKVPPNYFDTSRSDEARPAGMRILCRLGLKTGSSENIDVVRFELLFAMDISHRWPLKERR
jgi:hypothetical protein